MPKLKFVIICDNAFFGEKDNKLNINGVFNIIFSKSYPAIHEHMSVVIGLDIEEGNHTGRIEVIKEDETLLFKTPERSFFKERTNGHVIINNIEKLRFPAEGKYKVKCFIDNNFIGEEEITTKII